MIKNIKLYVPLIVISK